MVVRLYQSATLLPDGDDDTRGPMIPMHVVNNDFSPPPATMPPVQVTVSAEDLAAAAGWASSQRGAGPPQHALSSNKMALANHLGL